MRYIFAILWITLQANVALALDLGGLLKPTDQQDAATTSGETKKPGLSDLVGLVGVTPEEEEIAIGREITGRLLGASPLVKDEKLQRYVNMVGKWVALQSDRPKLPWRFGVIESGDINAFAAPGGYVLVTKGLYRKLGNEAELAGVLAHEIGHIAKKHHLKILKKGKAINLGKDLIGNQLGKGQGATIKKLVGSGAEIMARGLDKKAEFQADRIGVVLATRAGYDSYGLPTVLQEIGHVSANDSSVSLLFKTHPHPNTRLIELGDSMGSRFDAYEDGKSVEERFYRIKN